MKILITGSSGLVGSALLEYFFTKGYSILSLKRDRASGSPHFWATSTLEKISDSCFHTVIHLEGENVAHGGWTGHEKQQILTGRLEGTKQLIDYIAALKVKPTSFLWASTLDYYGSRSDEILDENSSLGTGFLADVYHQTEKETERLAAMGIRTINLRFGMILSPEGGPLHKIIPPFQAPVGGVIGSGKRFVSWISIKEVTRIIDFLIEKNHLCGPVNVVNPTPTTNREFTKALDKALNRPTLFKISASMAPLIFGRMADAMPSNSSRAIPKVLLDSGYEFQDQSLATVLHGCVENTS